jgi:hypothetical protein
MPPSAGGIPPPWPSGPPGAMKARVLTQAA